MFAISKPYAQMVMRGIWSIRFQRVYPGIMKYDMMLKIPMNKPTKLVTLRSSMLTLGYINVKRATMNGVVGQYITPKDEVSNISGSKFVLKSGFIGDQKAKTTSGTTQYLQGGSVRREYSFFGLKTSEIQKRPTMKIGTRLPVRITSP